jgi:hypothetical protein
MFLIQTAEYLSSALNKYYASISPDKKTQNTQLTIFVMKFEAGTCLIGYNLYSSKFDRRGVTECQG